MYCGNQVAARQDLKIRSEHIAIFAFLWLTGWFSSCKPKHICPAYQSSFYLDQKAAALEFSPFDKDTMPKLENLVRKTDVLLIVRLGKKKIENRMSVIPMITIYPEADSAIAISDSLSADSLAADDEMVPEEGDELIQDSTSLEEPDEPKADEAADEEARPKDETEETPEVPREEEAEKVSKKNVRRKAEKDPELSDPSLKFEFEESFQDSIPEDEMLNPLPGPDDVPVPKEGEKRRALPLNGDADKPKEEEAEDDKF